MNYLIILIFSLILHVSQNVITALITYLLIKIDMEMELTNIFIWYVPSFLISVAVFFTLALRDLDKPYIHAFLVYLLVELLGFISGKFIFDLPFYLSTLLISSALSALAILIGTTFGRLKISKINVNK